MTLRSRHPPAVRHGTRPILLKNSLREFGVVPGFVEADGVAPGRAVFFDDVHSVPAEFGDVIENSAFWVVFGYVLGFAHLRTLLCGISGFI